MAVEFEGVLASIGVLHVNLVVLQTGGQPLELAAVHSGIDLVVEEEPCGLPDLDPALLIGADFKLRQLVLLPEEGLVGLGPAPRPLANLLQQALVGRQVPQRKARRVQQQQERPVEQRAVAAFLGDAVQSAEVRRAEDAHLARGALHQVRVVQLQLQSPLTGLSDGRLGLKLADVAAIIEVDSALGPAEVVDPPQQHLLLGGSNLQLVQIHFGHTLRVLGLLLNAICNSLLPQLGLLLAQQLINFQLLLACVIPWLLKR